jgi:hypothetical protein
MRPKRTCTSSSRSLICRLPRRAASGECLKLCWYHCAFGFARHARRPTPPQGDQPCQWLVDRMGARILSCHRSVGCRWFRGPNFQANRLSVLAAICDKMQFGSLRWILQLRLPEHVGWWPIHCERAAATLAVDLRSPHCLRAKRAFAIAIVTRRAETPAGWLGEERSDE